jgi:hypothetical protein
MAGLRNGVVLLVLAVPFGLYAAWQVQGVSRADLLLPDPPTDKGLPGKEQLAATRAKTERWAGDVRKAAAVTLQFRTPGPDDAAGDGDCNALARAAARRAADLTDLEQFLSGVGVPTYTGALRARYLEWQSSKAALAKAEKAVEDWFTTPLPAIGASEDATRAMTAFSQLVAAYTKDSRFSEVAKTATWNVRARVRLVEALETVAEVPYARALEMPLPLPAEANSATVRQALGGPRAIREQVRFLRVELDQADDAGLTLPPRVVADAKAAVKRADEWAARERLLGLFAEPKLFTDPAGAADWLEKVNAQFDRTTSPDDRALLRRKVQQFCEAFVPRAVLLDAEVVLDGRPVLRSRVQVKHFPKDGGESQREELGERPGDGSLNEFTVAKLYPDDSTRVMYASAEYYPKQLRPTERSKAAAVYHEARRAMDAAPEKPKWSAKSIEQLKNKCKPVAAEVNRLKVTNDDPRDPRVWDRLESLAKGAAAYPQLFEKGQ